MRSARPRLTYLISSLEMGGAERGMTRILDGLGSEYDVTVVALRGGDRTVVPDIPDDVTVLDLAIESPRDLGRLWTLSRAVSGTDVLVCSLYHAVILGTVFGLLWRVPTTLVWQHNETFASPIRRRAFGLTARFADGVLADSTPVAEMLTEKFDSIAHNVQTVPIAGIDTDEFTPVQHGPSEETVVGILGTLTEQKNHDAVLAAAEQLRGEPIRFVVAGDGPRRAELTRAAEDRDVAVEFRGYVADAAAFLSELDVYVQPSHHEGLCLTALEAMACGLPVVATPVGGLAETVVNGVTGYHVPVGDVDSLVDAILRLHDAPDRRAEFGAAGRRRVRKNFSQTILVDAFRDAVESAGGVETAD